MTTLHPSGDYTEIQEYEESDANGEEIFTDISDKTALAVWTMVACDTIKMVHGTDREDAKAVKEDLLSFLKDKVCDYKTWESVSDVKLLLAAIETLIPEQTDMPATKRVKLVESGDD